MISGIITAVLLVAFVALIVWAYSPGRKRGFDEAASLALLDDAPRKEAAK